MNVHTVRNNDEFQAALQSGIPIDQIALAGPTAEELAVARAEGIAEGRALVTAEVIADAIAAERARVTTIHRLAGKCTKELVDTAVSSGMEPGVFATMLLHEIKRADAPAA